MSKEDGDVAKERGQRGGGIGRRRGYDFKALAC